MDDGLYMSARYLRGLLDYVAAHGADTAPVLAAMGIDEEALRNPDCHIPHAHQDRAFAEAERLTGDPNVGLHAGASMHVMHLGVVGQLAMTLCTGAELLDHQVRYQSLIGNGVQSSCIRTPSATYLDFELQRSAASRHTIEYSLSAQLTLAKRLAGPRFRARELQLPFDEPPEIDEQRRVLDCEVRYGCSHMRAIFDPEVNMLLLASSEPGVREALEQAAGQRLDSLRVRLEHDDSEVSQCQQYIADRLSGGAPNIEQTAQALRTSVRTLQRRLELRGLHYRELVENTRRSVAERLLLDHSLSLLDIAFLTGFSDQSAFTRAFRRWFDTTPSELRSRRAREGVQ